VGLGKVVDERERHPSRWKRGQPAADRVAQHAVDARPVPWPGAVHRRRIDDHDLDPVPALPEDELLGALLGALVRRALGVGGEHAVDHRLGAAFGEPPGNRVPQLASPPGD
jgi:hypothetical protein